MLSLFPCSVITTYVMYHLVVHKMDEAESNMISKGKECKVDKNARAKAINWHVAISEFFLDWYIETPPKAVFKKMHHTACIAAINKKYGCSYSVEQVQRHFRHHKETWGLVARYSNESGSGFDDVNKQVMLSQSTLDGLSVIISYKLSICRVFNY